jgi:hypothetical protein
VLPIGRIANRRALVETLGDLDRDQAHEIVGLLLGLVGEPLSWTG